MTKSTSNMPWQLIISKLKNELTPEKESLFQNWISQEDNDIRFEEIRLLWKGIQSKSSEYVPDTELYWQKMYIRMQEMKKESVAKSGFILWPKFYRYIAAACFLILLCGGTFYLGFKMTEPPSTTISYNNYSGKSKIVLPDGTEILLHNNTRIDYPSDFSARNRVVNITGEAFFNVKHDAEHPFLVQAGQMKVQVYGTKFNVNAMESFDQIYVSLVEGSVSLTALDKTVFLKPGEEGVFNKRNKNLEVTSADLNYVTLWTKPKIHFDNKSLNEISRYLSKWYNVNISVEPAIADKLYYTFTLRNESLEEVLRIMSKINPITYNFDSQGKLSICEK